MGWVLEAGSVEDEHQVTLGMVATDGGKVAVTGLLEGFAAVGDDHVLLVAATTLHDELSKACQVDLYMWKGLVCVHVCDIPTTRPQTHLVLSQHCCLSTIAQRETFHLAQGHALLGDLAQGVAAVEHGFVKVAPRPFPRPSGVDGEAVEHHGKAGQTAECWFVLRAKLFNQFEKALHGAGGLGLRKELLACDMVCVSTMYKTTAHLHQRKTARLEGWAAHAGKTYAGGFEACDGGRPGRVDSASCLLDLVVADELGCSVPQALGC